MAMAAPVAIPIVAAKRDPSRGHYQTVPIGQGRCHGLAMVTAMATTMTMANALAIRVAIAKGMSSATAVVAVMVIAIAAGPCVKGPLGSTVHWRRGSLAEGTMGP